MSAEDLDGPVPPEQLEQLLPDRTPEEIVQALVDANPAKHGLTLAQRLARVLALAKRDNLPDDYQRVYELRVEQIGGDPDEMLPGNKPRYTMDEETLAIKDHETGRVHHLAANQDAPTGGEPASPQTVEPGAAGMVATLKAQPQEDYIIIVRPDETAVHLFTPEGFAKLDESGDAYEVILHTSERPASEMCEHVWHEPVQADTPCSLCGLLFGVWAQS